MSKYLIIAGSEKCGTTSLFQYLADSGLFVISKSKETDYFRKINDISLEGYHAEFYTNETNKTYLEASPGYLSDSHISAVNISNTLTNYHLIFCLRNPVSRLQSSFAFHKSRLYIPKEMTFEDYFDECMKYEAGLPTDKALSEWCLRVPDCGKYYKHLSDFQLTDPNDITLVTFDELSQNPSNVLLNMCNKLNLDSNFYNHYSFAKSNVTTGHKNDKMQKIALTVNKTLESFWIKYPATKRNLLTIYRKLNGAPKEKITLSDTLRQKLFNYYYEDLIKLRENKSINQMVENWISSLKLVEK